MRSVSFRKVLGMTVVPVASWALSASALGESMTESAKLLAADGQPYDHFGYSLARSDDVIVVGTYERNVYTFRRNGGQWIEEQVLPVVVDSAQAVSISGDVIAVCGSGLYLFGWNGSSWDQEQWIGQPPGTRVSLSVDLLLLSRVAEGTYVFRRNGPLWVYEQALQGTDSELSDAFGASLAIRGDLAVVGAPRDQDNGLGSGSAYVFRFDGSLWIEEQKLLPSDGQVHDEFGESVGVDANVVVVGAPGADDHGFLSGSAYVFRFHGSSWVQEQELTPPDAAEGNNFGNSVGISGETIVVGSVNSGYGSPGAAHVFRCSGISWVHARQLVASDQHGGHHFGSRVAMNNEAVAVSATYDNDKGTWAGAVYVFDRVACPRGYFGPTCAECPGGAGNACSGHGTCDDDLDGTGECTCDVGFVGAACEGCAAGFFGSACQPCPGGASNPCSGNGVCDDGESGSGECECAPGFAGVACEDCAVGFFGSTCQECPGGAVNPCSGHGTCDDGIGGSGLCTCDAGYAGEDCFLLTIPTVSTWGLGILALLVLTARKLASLRELAPPR